VVLSPLEGLSQKEQNKRTGLYKHNEEKFGCIETIVISLRM
jgi:hypothetical protein